MARLVRRIGIATRFALDPSAGWRSREIGWGFPGRVDDRGLTGVHGGRVSGEALNISAGDEASTPGHLTGFGEELGSLGQAQQVGVAGVHVDGGSESGRPGLLDERGPGFPVGAAVGMEGQKHRGNAVDGSPRSERRDVDHGVGFGVPESGCQDLLRIKRWSMRLVCAYSSGGRLVSVGERTSCNRGLAMA